MFVLTVASSTKLNYVDTSAVYISKLNPSSVSIVGLGLLSSITKTDMKAAEVVIRNMDEDSYTFIVSFTEAMKRAKIL